MKSKSISLDSLLNGKVLISKLSENEKKALEEKVRNVLLKGIKIK